MHESSGGGPGPCCLLDAGSLNGPQTSPGWGLKEGLCSATPAPASKTLPGAWTRAEGESQPPGAPRKKIWVCAG